MKSDFATTDAQKRKTRNSNDVRAGHRSDDFSRSGGVGAMRD